MDQDITNCSIQSSKINFMDNSINKNTNKNEDSKNENEKVIL